VSVVEGTLTCVLVDDHPAVVKAVGEYLARNGVRVLRTESTVAGGARAIAAEQPDVAVVDLRLSDGSGLDLAREAIGGRTRFVLFTGSESEGMVEEGVRIGIKGFVRKDAPVGDVLRAIRAAAAGTMYIDSSLATGMFGDAPQHLTDRELAVLEHLAAGKSYAEIADELGIRPETARSHMQKALEKLGADTKTQAVAEALRRNLIN
jgi:DNA-binding NarL/FixJ family response regulator